MLQQKLIFPNSGTNNQFVCYVLKRTVISTNLFLFVTDHCFTQTTEFFFCPLFIKGITNNIVNTYINTLKWIYSLQILFPLEYLVMSSQSLIFHKTQHQEKPNAVFTSSWMQEVFPHSIQTTEALESMCTITKPILGYRKVFIWTLMIS